MGTRLLTLYGAMYRHIFMCRSSRSVLIGIERELAFLNAGFAEGLTED
jgi:hypothetical protein